MSDGLPSEEQLRRIERGVRDRIDLRRRVVRGIAGTTAGVALFAGAFALVIPLAGRSGGSTAAGGSTAGEAGANPAASAAPVAVRCHLEGGTTLTSAPDDPARIAAACGAAADLRALPQAAGASASPTSTLPPAVICRAANGAFEVYPAGDRPATACERRGLRPY